MPYIKQERREVISNSLEHLLLDIKDRKDYTAGDLNYIFTLIVKEYLGTNYNYQKINDCIGALEGCKLEFYARFARKYEDTKIKENGDVYE